VQDKTRSVRQKAQQYPSVLRAFLTTRFGF
jgi:hypothetical protein